MRNPFREVKCDACHRPLAACICASVQRRHTRENKKYPARGQRVVRRGNERYQWCACGALIRNGRCVSATCGA